jgi:class 3 adenylate cyclase/tetratricopeptide (TPR) repeat protein
MICTACGAENRPGRKFCSACGAPLARACPACGAANDPGDRFCGECGAQLDPAPPAAAATEPATERRLVSILFADLVGFTARSEDQDPEEVRDLLSRYFDAARRVIERYGGTVEKFIGDAVMAVWGTPVAQEDDAERAVRAALDLVAAVPELDPRLQARAGVLTGEAAVTVGAEGQGMVAGDLVNTASRVQGAAAAGTVLVGEATKRASDAAIAYEAEGARDLKGKVEPLPLWRAVRVVAGRGGEGRSLGLEPAFVGREAEFRLVKDLFHASADEGKARLVSVIGVAGLGKSRLTWEFEKYIDGLVERVYWHRGRCLAYGEGVAYWALGEMVRMRAGILEEEPPGSAVAKLQASLAEHVSDEDERSWLEPRLAHLLGLEERTAPDREDLFSAWRLFFERLAEQQPTVLVFEDLHWADAGLLDFVEYLLEWSRNHRLFVLTLARPELMDRRPNWGTGKLSFTSVYLEPLSDDEIEELLDDLVPGLPGEVRQRIGERSEGVPLYAVETVRMLLDRELLAREGDDYRPAGPLDELEVPETLHALIAARLDGLTAEERRVLADASVLGKTFTTRALAALTGLSESELEPILASLVRKEILTRETDPRSPERGQHAFLQDLLRQVTYETLARADRKVRHLAVAEFLETGWASEEEEIVEVIAAHYLEAYRVDPEADDAPEIRTKALELLARAGERASSLAASEEAQRYFEQAAALAEDPLSQARLFERSGEMARLGGRFEEAGSRFEQAVELFEAEGRSHAAARAAARLGETLWYRGRIAEAVELMTRSFEVLRYDVPDEELATLAAMLGRLLFFTGDAELAAERIEFALEIAESVRLPGVLADALNTKALVLWRRPEEAHALLRHALELALENDLSAAALRSYTNLCDHLLDADRHDEALEAARQGLAVARKRGDRFWEWAALAHMAAPLYLLGDWDEALARGGEVPFDAIGPLALLLFPLARIYVSRGQNDEARETLASSAAAESSEDIQERTAFALAEAIVLRAEGQAEAAYRASRAVMPQREVIGRHRAAEALVEAAEAAFALGDTAQVERLLEEARQARPVELTQYLEAQIARMRGRLAAEQGDPESAGQAFKQAAALFRELATPFWLAVTQVEEGDWLSAQGRSDDAAPLLGEAREIFERLRARPWLERVARLAAPEPVEAT